MAEYRVHSPPDIPAAAIPHDTTMNIAYNTAITRSFPALGEEIIGGRFC